MENQNETWTEIISPHHSLFDLKLGDIWKYKDLLFLMVKRDFVANYKQTILGPLWFFINPLITSLMFTVIFGGLAGISTDGTPKMLFYLSGLTLWNYFQDCLNGTAIVFRNNASIFGKVYFPRLIMPLSTVIGNLLKFGLQFLLFLGFLIYFLIRGADIHPNWTIVLLPFLLVLMAGMGLGLGMIISSMTTKYRDMTFLLGFGITLFMYATPVIYPLSVTPEKYRWIMSMNPVASIVETFRYSFLGSGRAEFAGLLYSTVFTIVCLLLGTLVFNKVERSFMDTV